VTPGAGDPRDPLGLAGDAPLLDGWLRFGAVVGAGTVTPFTIPGHKQRTQLVGDVVRGDVPLYAGLDPMKQDGGLLARAEQRAAAAWRTGNSGRWQTASTLLPSGSRTNAP
jgi:arginine decarboxylase